MLILVRNKCSAAAIVSMSIERVKGCLERMGRNKGGDILNNLVCSFNRWGGGGVYDFRGDFRKFGLAGGPYLRRTNEGWNVLANGESQE